MNIAPNNIIPITQARGKLGDLAESISGDDYIILTKGGSPKVALVDINYLNKLQSEVNKIYRKTYINPDLLPYTREFSDKETNEWLDEDKNK